MIKHINEHPAGGRIARCALPFCVACALLLSSLPSWGGQDPGEEIEVAAAYLVGRLDEDPESGYNVLIQKLLPSKSHYFKYQRYPLPRAIRKFEISERICLFPASALAVQSLTKIMANEVLESVPIDLVSSHVISAPGRKVYQSFDELRGATMAVQFGVAAREFVETAAQFEIVRTPNDLLALRMVLAHRVDVMYGWYPDTYIIAEKNYLPLPRFDPELVIFRTTTHLVCKKFSGAEELLQVVNIRINDLRKRGELQKILGKYARIALP